MKSFKFTAIFCVLFFKITFSQDHYYKTYNWEKNPKVFAPSESEKKSNDLVIIFEKNFYEVAYDADGQAAIYETYHYLIHVNSPKAVDAVNKGYMALDGVNEEIDLKARCITADSKIMNFNKSTLKSVDNFEGAGPYKIFAIDGVEVGCDVEIMYTNKKQYYTYSYHHIQSKNPMLHYEARIISPANLIYETKSYNNLDNFKSDTSNKEKNHLYLIQKNIKQSLPEKYSAGKANYMGFIAQLTYNVNKKKSRLYTWDIISKEYYDGYYNLEKSLIKPIIKSVEKNKFAKIESPEEKIKAIETFIKTNFEINDSYKNLTIEKAIDSKKMSTSVALAYFINAFKFLEVPFELVITTERSNVKFDPKFPSYMFAKEFLLFFPGINKYMSPFSIYSRLGFPEQDCLNNEGLFIKEVNIGDIFSSSAKVKLISPPGLSDSYHNSNVLVKLDFTNKTANLNVTQTMQGYSCYYYQPVYRYFTKEQKDELNKAFFLTENADAVKNLDVQNIEEKDLFSKPLVVKYDIELSDFLENAGNKFIFKVGLLIGPQAELYQEEERKWPGYVHYPHFFKREIEINIPDGYKATNLNDIVINKVCTVDGKPAATFKSEFQLKDNKILITAYEDYKVTDYPLQNFNEFKDVINAAADFNKKSIVFEKK